MKRLVVMAAACMAVTAAAQADAPKTLPSGVIYQSLKTGSGKHPGATDAVTVNYRGTLMDGSEFDSSYKRGQPASFRLNQVIPCWAQGVQLMQPGGKAKFTCPAATAYGPDGIPGTIPPNATLKFDVELISINQGSD